MKCITCGKNSDSEYCFQHKPRKPLSSDKGLTSRKSSIISKKLDKSPGKFLEMRQFFLSIWKKKPHKSEVSGTYLGKEPSSLYFHHILPKSKYPELRNLEENIIILTPDEHANVEADMYKYEEINRRRDELLKKYDIL